MKHLNDHSNSAGGDFDEESIAQIFANTSKEVLTSLLDAYSGDFLMCGYNKTVQGMKELLTQKE